MIQVPSEMIAADDPRRPRAHCLHCQRIRVLRHGDTCGDCTRDQGGPVHQRGTTVGPLSTLVPLYNSSIDTMFCHDPQYLPRGLHVIWICCMVLLHIDHQVWVPTRGSSGLVSNAQ
ncbi:hypothetical protein WJX77_003045 [Trebouxia sp. C0004]